jgi:hypothetical protein
MSVISGPNTVRNGLMGVLDAGHGGLFSSNIFPNPTDIFAWNALGNSSTLTRATGVESPVGNTPIRMLINATDPHFATTNKIIAPAAQGQTWTASAWVKGSTAMSGAFFIFGINSAGTFIEAPSGAVTITTGWTRVSFTTTFTNANTVWIGTRFDGPDSGSTGQTIYIDGYQLERSSSRTAFNPRPNSNGASSFDGYGRTITLYGNVAFDGISWILPPDQTTSYLMNTAYPWPTGDFTAEHWMRSTFNQPNQTPYTYSVGGDNQYLMFTGNSTTYQPHSFNGAASVTVPNMNNTWHCFTRNRVAGTGVERYYHNGVFVGTATVSADVAATTNGYLIIGQEADSPGGSFDPNQNLDGRFGRLMIYNRALSDAEILQNYNAVRSRYGL